MLNIKYTPEESPSPSRWGGSREENYILDKSSSGSNKRQSKKISKRDALEKYQEHDDGSSYMNDFDMEGSEDLNLSYSKFSRISGISLISGGDSNRLNSISGSPFVKNIQTRLQDIKFEEERKLNSRDSGRPITKLNRPKSSQGRDKLMYLIDEGTLKNANDENESPFLDHAPILKTPIEKIGSTFEDNFDLKPKNHDPLQNPKVRGSSEQLENYIANGSKIPISSTPDKRRQQRMSSVKVSLTPAQRFEKRPGTRLTNALENFQFSTLVGRGASANVFKGINLKTNQVVAIKQIVLEKNQNVMELMGEIDLLKILKHPNIVKYHGFVKTSTSLNVFLEFCSKGSLRQLYQHTNHGLPEGQIIGFVRQILQGLHYLHEQGVVHRDVKAANVLITEDGFIKLADFGVATKVSSQHETVVGTPNWMAPETVLGGEGLCTASDIWSLGATIIELFTTNPPYHDLNPMATLHAIGTDDHPPLPKNISPLAKDFLLECFQKQPNLRISAKSLLKHKWVTKSAKEKHTLEVSSQINSGKHIPNPVSIHNYSESNEENWENDFIDINLQRMKSSSADPLYSPSRSNGNLSKVSKSELLNKFLDKNEDFEFELETPIIISKFDKTDDLQLNLESTNLEESPREEEEEDPFLEIDIEDFDTNELEVQSKMEFLTTKFSNRVDLCHSGNDEVITSVVKITGRMLHLIKKYNTLHDVLIRDHGILSLLELLESAPELPKHQKLWFHTLSILNNIFEKNTSQFENFCLLGGIPVVTHFRSSSYDPQVRLQVVKFIKFLNESEKALSMFVSCGGLRVLSKFVEEDFDATPEFPLTSIDCIYNILSKDLTRSKSNLCRILSKYGVIFWFVVLLNRLTKSHSKSTPDGISQDQIYSTINKIIEIIKYFGQSETRVRVNISNSDLFKLLIKVYPNLQYQHQLVILKFFKSISQISDILKTLYSADILEFLVRMMEFYTPSREHYKEVINIVCPTLYNCCYLNHAREIDLVRLGAVPHLKALSKINLPFRQFVLPILCELVHCDDYVRQILFKQDILTVYFNLLIDPYWQSNALDSILSWSQQSSDQVKLDTPKAINCFVGGFMLPKVSNLESTLDSYLKLITVDKAVCYLMVKESIINNILLKLNVHNKIPVVQLNLLRILKNLVNTGKKTRMLDNLDVSQNLITTLNTLKSRKTSVLVDELAMEIVSLVS